MNGRPQMIVSGGQTGADRTALDWAIEYGVPHAGWCPKGRQAEDGSIPSRYQLSETPTTNYLQRTEWNARDTDATVIFSIAETLTGSCRRTAQLARKHGKPCLHLSKETHGPNAADCLLAFMDEHQVRTLNVAGPRASDEPSITEFVKEVLLKVWVSAA